mgnify:CR=1 FL=1
MCAFSVPIKFILGKKTKFNANPNFWFYGTCTQKWWAQVIEGSTNNSPVCKGWFNSEVIETGLSASLPSEPSLVRSLPSSLHNTARKFRHRTYNWRWSRSPSRIFCRLAELWNRRWTNRLLREETKQPTSRNRIWKRLYWSKLGVVTA